MHYYRYTCKVSVKLYVLQLKTRLQCHKLRLYRRVYYSVYFQGLGFVLKQGRSKHGVNRRYINLLLLNKLVKHKIARMFSHPRSLSGILQNNLGISFPGDMVLCLPCQVPPASKDEQLRLVQDARAESKKGQGKGKPKAKAKGKAKAKASAKSKAKAVAKKQPKAKGSMKRPAAAAFVGEALTDDPVEEEKPEEHECEDPEPLPLNDVVPDAASLPNTFARRGKPTSAKGLVKYGRIVEAFEQHIVPTVQGRKMCDAQDPIRPKYSFACSKHQLTTFDILVLIVCCFLYLKPLLSEASMHPCAVPVLRPRAAEHAPLA